MMPLRRRFMWWWQRRRKEDQVREELQFHLDQESEERRDAGLSDHEARTAARRDLGNDAQLREDIRALWTWRPLDELAQDLRFAFRTHLKNRAVPSSRCSRSGWASGRTPRFSASWKRRSGSRCRYATHSGCACSPGPPARAASRTRRGMTGTASVPIIQTRSVPGFRTLSSRRSSATRPRSSACLPSNRSDALPRWWETRHVTVALHFRVRVDRASSPAIPLLERASGSLQSWRHAPRRGMQVGRRGTILHALSFIRREPVVRRARCWIELQTTRRTPEP
jgi:hypothetical protein